MASSTFVGRQYSLNFDFAVQDDHTNNKYLLDFGFALTYFSFLRAAFLNIWQQASRVELVSRS
ncbi:hypothetical protein T4E_10038 [Trichinella pseudospiralis]|uniref:Uncharacterized protein n=1 Tax=Trichinella pseudospiralis TaxID=6337 RepID=A0A0V0Y5R2_TRIPS|nr:hypothetical protein T4E_10038 [Trichinella pseudospiralis]KRY84679.1 hypothetical protein T4D_10598 [Trichinella pseudospiralis]KRY84683.1 hypothetical protein T4D_267 [Trichinella pseudospiralis]